MMTCRNRQFINAMTVDVEDYFQVSAFEKIIDRKQWDSIACRVEDNTRKILALFKRHNVKATFFTLGWVAERYPQLVKDIVADGHELACHGQNHIRVTEQTPEQFRADIIQSKRLLEEISGVVVNGYRAASYSIGASNLWALDILEEAGFLYSSSIYPVKHDLYGMPDAPRFSFRPTEKGTLIEVPVTTTQIMNKNFPCGGGGFFRLYPYALSKWAINRVNKKDNQSAVFYFHPWEIDPDQPRQKAANFKSRFRHYLNLHKTEARLDRLLGAFNWGTMQQVFIDSNNETAKN
jgi:polysaccharide deacetylase family protein (PEP-CTERM system associated)